MTNGKEVAAAVSSLLNCFGNEERIVFIEQMSRDHRSLQQAFTRLCVDWFRQIATSDHDLRNEASVKLAQKILPTLDQHVLPRF